MFSRRRSVLRRLRPAVALVAFALFLASSCAPSGPGSGGSGAQSSSDASSSPASSSLKAKPQPAGSPFRLSVADTFYCDSAMPAYKAATALGRPVIGGNHNDKATDSEWICYYKTHGASRSDATVFIDPRPENSDSQIEPYKKESAKTISNVGDEAYAGHRPGQGMDWAVAKVGDVHVQVEFLEGPTGMQDAETILRVFVPGMLEAAKDGSLGRDPSVGD